MPTVVENALTLTFPPTWDLVKWDDHPLHRAISGRAFKGVDVVCSSPDGPVVVEIKDYRTTGQPPPTTLPEVVDAKVRGTLLALGWAEPNHIVRTDLNGLETHFRSNTHVKVVLWVELAFSPNPGALLALKTEIERQLAWMHGRASVLVVDHHSGPHAIPGLACILQP